MLSESQIDRVFPFHFLVGADLRLRRCGPSLAAVCADARVGAAAGTIFAVERPEPPRDVDAAWLRERSDQLFLLRHRASGLPFRGQWLAEDEAGGALRFVGSPWITHPEELSKYGLNLRDFALHDPLVDLLQLAQAQEVALDDAKLLAEKLTRQRTELRSTNQQLAGQNATLAATERRLREREAEAQKLALVAERTTNAVVVTDARGCIEWANAAFTRLTGYSLDEVRGQTPGSVLQGPGTDQHVVREIGEMLRRGQGFERELLNYDKAGRPYMVHLEVQPIHDEQGAVTHFMAVQSDITGRVRNDIRRNLRATISAILAETESRHTGIEATIEAIARALDFDVGIYWEVARQGTTLEQHHAWQAGRNELRQFVEASARFRPAPGEELPGKVWRDKGVAWVLDVAQEGDFPRMLLALQAGLKRAIALPVPILGEVAGVFEFLGGQHFLPDSELPSFLQQTGEQVGLFLARVRAQEAMRQERDFATQVMALMGQGIAVTGVDRRIEYCNEAFAALIGRPGRELIGLYPPEFLTAEERKKFSNRWWFRALRQRLTFETRLQRADGAEIFVLVTSVPRLRDGQPSGHISTITDLSDRKKVEEALQQAKEAAETANRTKNDFLATVSHEIRTPMNAVIGMTSLLRETRLDAQQREFVEAVQGSSEALLEIIDDILDFAKIESRRVTLVEQDFELEALVDGAVELLAPRAYDKGLEITAIVDPEVSRNVRGDDGRLRQVLVNLVGNAIKFTKRGEVIVRVTREAPAGSREVVRFAVTDTGIGIPREQQAAVFEPFVQADNTSSRRFQGTGLGLTISRRLVDLLGGTMGLQSAPDQGSTFWFTVPLTLSGRSVAGPDGSALAGLRVLMLDRHEIACESVRKSCRPWGLRLETTSHPAEVCGRLDAAAREGDPFKGILIDGRSLSETDAPIAARLAETLVKLRPKIILLGWASPSGLLAETEGTVDARLTKPLKTASLLQCLLSVMAERTAPAVAGPAAPAGPVTRALRILVVEDREINRRFAQLMLERLGYRGDFVSNGEEAVVAARRTSYDVVFMDCQMPVKDGYTATREIRALEAAAPEGRRHRACIIAMTANAVSDNRVRCLDSGMDEFLTKPVRIERVAELLRRVTPGGGAASGGETPGEPAPGIDSLRKEFGDTAAREMVEMFLRDTPERIGELHRLRDRQDWKGLGRAAHMLAGSCAIFDLTEMRATCLRLEEACSRQPEGDFAPMFTIIEQGFAAVRPGLAHWEQKLAAGTKSAG